MLDDETTTDTSATPAASAPAAPRRRRAASRPAGPPAPVNEGETPHEEAGAADQPAAKKPAAKKKSTAKKTTTKKSAAADDGEAAPSATKTRKAAAKAAVPPAAEAAEGAEPAAEAAEGAEPAVEAAPAPSRSRSRKAAAVPPVDEPAESGTDAAETAPLVIFQPPDTAPKRTRSSRKLVAVEVVDDAADLEAEAEADEDELVEPDADDSDAADETDAGDPARRRRRRGGRRRRGRGGDSADADTESAGDEAATEEREGEAGPDDDSEDEGGTSRRRRRRRRRGAGGDDDSSGEDPPNTVVRVRAPRDGATAVRGSTRLEAKKQRRRDGREAGRRRAPVLSEAEFLARREDVDRVMVVREKDNRIQIAVLEDGMLVEHYVDRGTSGSMVGNVYLGRVQNVLPSMEAAFVDIGRGRNAVLYAGEVNWDAAGLEGQPKRIEFALKSGDPVLVQVTKDPLGHKGARLTSQISLPGRYLVYVPGGGMTGISRKLPDTERARLKKVLKDVVPDGAGVIIRTAAEGASEDELQRDVSRLSAQWADIEVKAATASPPTLLYGEPDLAIRVVRDIFNEDFTSLVVSGHDVWETLDQYVTYVAPDLSARITKWVDKADIFSHYRIDEQLTKAFDRKVWLPSGGSLVIDRTEAMTVVDVNTGKFTGQGGNLEETVTSNNLEAAEEIVRQLRLRDIGGIIVVDFIDMVLESNRDAVLRRLVECLGRDRTKHQVAEITSLGLVQMTRKRIGQGLLETFSESCEHCNGRGVKIHSEPVMPSEARSQGTGAKTRKGADPAASVRPPRARGKKAAGAAAEAEEVVEADEAVEVEEAVDLAGAVESGEVSEAVGEADPV